MSRERFAGLTHKGHVAFVTGGGPALAAKPH